MRNTTSNCEFCQSPAHIWLNCPKKPDGWKPDRLIKSTAARMDVRQELGVALGGPTEKNAEPLAGTQAPPVDTSLDIRKPGRPKNGFDKAAYNRDYMRKRRAEDKRKREAK